ncbi:hypothetical protein SDC9_102902 [bioreactor metagenome]|uniref:DUF3791 domain-containing protein n=1 Tax=bioreactor metagenome TaxID=1076179 RepID=A0A645AYX8_9ZZZZ
MKQDQMTLDEKKAEFVAFCIESYKMKLGGVSGVKVAEYFNDYGAIDFLLENYDLLHTLGRDQVLSEIERYLKKRGA